MGSKTDQFQFCLIRSISPCNKLFINVIVDSLFSSLIDVVFLVDLAVFKSSHNMKKDEISRVLVKCPKTMLIIEF